MNDKHVRAVAIFVAICSVSAIVAWVGGYDFNYRSLEVGLWSAGTLAIAAVAAGMTLDL